MRCWPTSASGRCISDRIFVYNLKYGATNEGPRSHAPRGTPSQALPHRGPTGPRAQDPPADHHCRWHLKPGLQLRLGQSQTLSPQMQQAIQLLQLPQLELTTRIQEALEENVMLELEEPEEPDLRDGVRAERDEPEVETEWASGEYSAPRGDSGRDRAMEAAAAEAPTLQDHLGEQLNLTRLEGLGRLAAEAVIQGLDDDGYLAEPLEQLCEGLVDLGSEQQRSEMESALKRVQYMDPPGVAARDLVECLCIQLRQLEPDSPGLDTARRLVEGHLPTLAKRDMRTLGRALNVDDEELGAAVALVRSLNPRPAAGFLGGAAESVVPDVMVREADGRWRVEINPNLMPRIRVNSAYAAAIARKSGHADLRAQLNEARWLVRSLEIRNETLLRVATSIVEEQRAFLERGELAMKPLVMREIAERVDMHESTISRVVAGKYMHTPRGLYEFRYFFSSHVRTTDGGEASAVAIRAMIKELVADEDPGKPLSDNGLSSALGDAGVRVARRTVTKYREAMNIPSSTERRRLARQGGA